MQDFLKKPRYIKTVWGVGYKIEKTEGTEKNKRLRYIRLFAALYSGSLICYTIYIYSDVFFNGAFVDWVYPRGV